MQDIIEVKNLSFTYGGANALEDISFIVKQGDFTGVLGHNGSGKTTLIQLILGLLKAKGASIKLFGQEINKFNLWQNIGYLEQKKTPPALMPLTAFEVARLGLLCTKKTPKIFTRQDNDAVNEILSKLNCADYKDKLFGELSGGQQQRVLLARALINNPRLIILDEPATALDKTSREGFFELLSALNKQNNATILLITHDIAEIGKYVNKFFILDKKLIFHGDKQSFCASKVIEEYFGPYTPHIMDHLHADGCCPLEGCK